MLGGKFAPLTIMNTEDTDLNSLITTFNIAVTETAREIIGKHRQKKKSWITAEILDLCGKRRELRKKRFEPEGSEKYEEVTNKIKRCMRKAKENWIGEQCSEIKRKSVEEQQYEGIPTGERLDHCETGESDYCPRSFRKIPHRRATDAEPMDRILL